MRRYWDFFWPLTFMGTAMLLAQQFQNATLARYPEATMELAAFAVASGLVMLFRSSSLFLPQLLTVFARSRESLRRCMIFALALSVVLALPMAWLAFTHGGQRTLAALFGVEGLLLHRVADYLAWLMPMLLIDNLRAAYTGLLVQARRTGIISVSNVLFLALMAALLSLGFQMKLPALAVLVGAQTIAATVHLGTLALCFKRYYHLPKLGEKAPVSYWALARFFAPVTVTGAAFAISRPLVFVWVGRMDEPEAIMAAIRVSFDFIMLFNNPVNQFRHLYVTFIAEDPVGLRKFSVYVVGTITVVMLLIAATPLGVFLLRDLLGVEGEVLEMSRIIILIHVIGPAVIAFRNYYHGLAMVEKRTGKIGLSSAGRVFMIAFGGWLLLATGLIDYWTIAIIHCCAFIAEAVIVWTLSARRPTRPFAV